ncbi:MAG: DUF177 domain-containing protein [Thermodesulforhabdaceae bacterium]
MKLRVSDIPDQGISLSFAWSKTSLDVFMAPNDPYEIDFVEPLDVQVTFEKRAKCIHVSGSVRGTLTMTCHRCLDHFHWHLNLSLETFLFNKTQIDTLVEDEEVELENERLEEEFFDGEEIDVDLIIAEEIFLSLPQVLLCSENCKGLCPQCGANLNRESCTCRKMSSSPFAVLLQRKNLLPAAHS